MLTVKKQIVMQWKQWGVCRRYLCMEEGQTPDSVEWNQHFDQELFMLRFQWQSETINYTEGRREE